MSSSSLPNDFCKDVLSLREHGLHMITWPWPCPCQKRTLYRVHNPSVTSWPQLNHALFFTVWPWTLCYFSQYDLEPCVIFDSMTLNLALFLTVWPWTLCYFWQYDLEPCVIFDSMTLNIALFFTAWPCVIFDSMTLNIAWPLNL